MRMYINYISKLEFLYSFREAFFASLIEKNIRSGFIGAGLVLYDLERMLSKFDIKLRTPIPLNSRAGSLEPWVFQTLYNSWEANV